MSKWYENSEVDNSIVISGRIRLARNIKKYNFPTMISKDDASNMIEEVKGALLNDRTPLSSQFEYYDMSKLNENQKLSLMEKHIISPILVKKSSPCGVIVKDDETVNIMINEEDHIRIQVLIAGDNIEAAWDMADKIDDLIEESVEYAFDENVGYMTACPTNVGTGLRASFMVHIPALEASGQIRNVVQAVSKFGITVRGTYGEGTEALGSIYQISNQVTLGRSEKEIIDNLKKVVRLVTDQELKYRDSLLKDEKIDFRDKVYRSYGILKYARSLSGAEAMNYLSYIRIGYASGILDTPKPKTSLLSIMMNIQPGSIQDTFDSSIEPLKRDRIRAKYIREQFV